MPTKKTSALLHVGHSKTTNQTPKVGQLQVWWVPQVPMNEFAVNVSSPQEGARLLAILAAYDLFQYANKVKPDYANAGGLRVWVADTDGHGTPGWEEWHDEVTDDDVDAAFDTRALFLEIKVVNGDYLTPRGRHVVSKPNRG